MVEGRLVNAGGNSHGESRMQQSIGFAGSACRQAPADDVGHGTAPYESPQGGATALVGATIPKSVGFCLCGSVVGGGVGCKRRVGCLRVSAVGLG